MTEGNPTVEEARAKLALWTYPYTGIDPLGFAHDLDALIEAVRQEERERAYLDVGGRGGFVPRSLLIAAGLLYPIDGEV